MAASLLLQAVYSFFEADSTLTSLVQGIFDEVPENEPFPFLVLSDTTEVPLDGYQQTRRMITLTIHTWSIATGMEEIEAIMGRVLFLLHHESLSGLTGYTSISCEGEFATVLRESDGITRHGVQRFRFLVEKNGAGY